GDGPQSEVGAVEIGVLVQLADAADMGGRTRNEVKLGRRRLRRLVHDAAAASGRAAGALPSQPHAPQWPSRKAAKPSGDGRPLQTMKVAAMSSDPDVHHKLQWG